MEPLGLDRNPAMALPTKTSKHHTLERSVAGSTNMDQPAPKRKLASITPSRNRSTMGTNNTAMDILGLAKYSTMVFPGRDP